MGFRLSLYYPCIRIKFTQKILSVLECLVTPSRDILVGFPFLLLPTRTFMALNPSSAEASFPQQSNSMNPREALPDSTVASGGPTALPKRWNRSLPWQSLNADWKGSVAPIFHRGIMRQQEVKTGHGMSRLSSPLAVGVDLRRRRRDTSVAAPLVMALPKSPTSWVTLTPM